MATIITYTTASPHGLTFITSGDGVGGALPVNRATILAACHDGPFKAFLTRTADWTLFNQGGSLCGKVHVRELVNRGAIVGGGASTSFEFFWTANGIKLITAGAGGGVGTCQIEIRLSHTERR